jgi:hypothetical protein
MKLEVMLFAQKGPTLRSEQILIMDGQRMSSRHPEALSLTPTVFTTSAMSFEG